MDCEKKMVVMLTVDELVDKIREALKPELITTEKNNFSEKKRYAFGLAGIAETFGVSIVSAHRIKRSGAIDAAISQVGRRMVLDVDLALELTKKKKKIC